MIDVPYILILKENNDNCQSILIREDGGMRENNCGDEPKQSTL
jgi:hypothetical protein